MAVPLAGFTTLRLLRSSSGVRVYEAERDRDHRRVLAKVFEIGDETIEARVTHELHLLQQLDLDGVVRPLGIERAGRELVLLLDWVEGQNLAEAAAGRPVPVERFLTWALAMTSTLAEVHARQIIHRDIKPSNILVAANSGRIVFADFGISVLLERARRDVHDPAVLEGTLPYVSPEQTGRTTRGVDFRSDLYSLGVTFYELLTGRRPFESTTPLELIHAHLARTPEPPRQLIPRVPERLSALVMRLLEKAPEHRYQSAKGLHADLARLAEALSAGIREPSFPLGHDDLAQVLQLPHGLYGREAERELLTRELDAVLRDRSRRTLVIRGALGVGKSALIAEIEGPLSERHGYLASAKFEEQARDTPYSAVLRGCQGLIEQLLTLSDAELERWRAVLREALGAIADVVVKLLPELALVVGSVDPVPELPPAEAKNRLHFGFARLLSGLSEVGPLVLALDDLQWADDASVELLSALLRDGSGPLLVLLGCRSDVPAPAVDAMIEALLAEGRPCELLELEPLSRDDLERLLADALGDASGEIWGLASYIERKTERRPLLVRRLLRYLADEDLLRPGPEGWQWDLDAITELAISDDALDVLDAALRRISPEQRALLEAAACVGERFDPRVMPTGVGEEQRSSPAQIFAGLHALEHAGLIDVIGPRFRFAHPRLRASVYRDMDPLRRRLLHAAIGRRLLGLARAELLDDEDTDLTGAPLFTLVDQLDSGYYPIDDEDPDLALGPGQRRELAELNLAAGDQALAASAWGTARRYFQCAVSLFGPGELSDRARFQARFGHAQTLHLDGELALAEAAFEALLAERLSLSDQAAVTARRIRVLAHTGQTQRAVAVAVEALRRCEFDVEPGATLAELQARLSAVVGETTLERLRALAPLRDERVHAIATILYALNTLTFTVDRELFVHFITSHLQLGLSHGFHVSLVGVLHNIAFALLGLDEFDEARRISEIGLALGEQRGAGVSERLIAERAWMLFIGPCFSPFREFAEQIGAAHRHAVEAGERTDAAYKGALGLVIQLEACVHLGDVWANFERFHADHEDWGEANMKAVAGAVLWFHAQMTGARPGGSRSLPAIAQADDPELSSTIHYSAVITRVWAAVLLGDHALAWAEAEAIAEDYEAVLFGSWAGPRFAVLDAVVTGARALGAAPEEREALRARLDARVATLERWARQGPENFQPCLDIAVAERAIMDGELMDAISAYEHARELAAAHGRAYVEGLACLRLAALADELEWSALSEGALRGALRVFERWGAWAVVEAIEERMGSSALPIALREPRLNETLPSPASMATGATGALSSLDLSAVLDLVQSISEDLRLEEVITRVLGSTIESAGADRGMLLLEREGQLFVVAEGREGKTTAFLQGSIPLSEAHDQLPLSAIRYVLRTGAALVVDDLMSDARFSSDPYIQRSGVRSLLCMAIVKQNAQIGALVLENRLQTGAFTQQRLETSRILLAQAASALDNARLYAELARNEAQWRSLVDGAPDIIMLLDERGHIEFINHLDPYEIDAAALIGEPGDSMLEPASARSWREALGEVMGTGELRELELCMAPPGAPRRWYMTRLAAIPMAGRLRRVLSIATDITARKGFEALQRQQQRLESIGTLAAGVAHEINNPIQGILNYAELVAGRADDPATVREFAGEITYESERVATIVRNLLVFSRQEREQSFEVVAISKLVAAALSLIRSVLRKDAIALELDLDDGLELRCRPQQIQQIIMNLVTNARDALNERYAGFDERKRIRIAAEPFERDGPWLRISVEDQAGGIPEDVLAHIFDPFYTTKGRDQGTGLGLSVSHGIASEHGGELRVETSLGVGSRFLLELPAVSE